MSKDSEAARQPIFGAADLPVRVATALVMAAFALGTAYIGGAVFAVFWSLVASAVYYEFRRLSDKNAASLIELGIVGLVFIALALVAVRAVGPTPIPREALISLTALVAIVALVTVMIPKPPSRLAWMSAAFAYALVIAVAPSILRGMGDIVGLGLIIWLFGVVWGTDIFAYFGGRAIGGAKLWPSVSPNKTWSGLLVGVVMGGLIGALIIAFWPRGSGAGSLLDFLMMFLVSSAVALVSQGGDLLESSLKRHFGAKDTSAVLPGHGGVMDRIDGFWAACLLVIAYFSLGLG